MLMAPRSRLIACGLTIAITSGESLPSYGCSALAYHLFVRINGSMTVTSHYTKICF
jgi:hypothetical protein